VVYRLAPVQLSASVQFVPVEYGTAVGRPCCDQGIERAARSRERELTGVIQRRQEANYARSEAGVHRAWTKAGEASGANGMLK